MLSFQFSAACELDNEETRESGRQCNISHDNLDWLKFLRHEFKGKDQFTLPGNAGQRSEGLSCVAEHPAIPIDLKSHNLSVPSPYRNIFLPPHVISADAFALLPKTSLPEDDGMGMHSANTVVVKNENTSETGYNNLTTTSHSNFNLASDTIRKRHLHDVKPSGLTFDHFPSPLAPQPPSSRFTQFCSSTSSSIPPVATPFGQSSRTFAPTSTTIYDTDALNTGNSWQQQYGSAKCAKTLGPARVRNRAFLSPGKSSVSDCSAPQGKGGYGGFQPARLLVGDLGSAKEESKRGLPAEKPSSSFQSSSFQSEVEEIKSAINEDASGGSGECLRDDILQLVLSMRMSASERVEEKDVIGLQSIKKLLRDKIINPILRPDLHQGLHQAPRGILLFGPPGTGKTTLAKWMATASVARFFEVTPSSLISKFYGETETLIKTLFKVAELQSPSILFIDEIDSLLTKRRDKEDDTTIRMKNQLLQMMDGVSSDPTKMVVIVGATNRPDMLDDAALRRLTKRAFVPLPDTESRAAQIKALLAKHLDSNSMLSDQEIHTVSSGLEGWNGSDVKALCAKAADFSYDETVENYGGIQNVPDRSAFRPISFDDFRRAAVAVRPSSNSESTLDFEKWAQQFGCD